MKNFSIPVDPTNLGQVMACIGFLEAAQELCGRTRGSFGLNGTSTEFILEGSENPFERVLEFLANAEIRVCVPKGVEFEDPAFGASVELEGYPTSEFKEFTPVIELAQGTHVIRLGHWADDSSRDSFKLFAGSQKTHQIIRNMLYGDSKKKQQGVRDFWSKRRKEFLNNPFEVTTGIGGSFNFDPRGAWSAIDVGYSPNDQGQGIASSPLVEVLAAWGLEHSRPKEHGVRKVDYYIWNGLVPPSLARPVFGGAEVGVVTRKFTLELGLSGKNKFVTYSKEVIK